MVWKMRLLINPSAQACALRLFAFVFCAPGNVAKPMLTNRSTLWVRLINSSVSCCDIVQEMNASDIKESVWKTQCKSLLQSYGMQDRAGEPTTSHTHALLDALSHVLDCMSM